MTEKDRYGEEECSCCDRGAMTLYVSERETS